MNITKEKTVAEVVTENIKASHIFKKYEIDFCCGGGITIEKACEKNGVDFNELKSEFLAINESGEDTNNYNNWKLPFLIDYIVNIHHSYVEESIPLIQLYAAKVAKVHGAHYPEVVKINTLFQEVSKELSAHMKKEELILFPFIKQLTKSKENETDVPRRNFSSVESPIAMMEKEHEDAGDIFKEIAAITANYQAPEGACNTFRALYDKLSEFEEDLHKHIHLENNILHPKAIALEKELQL